MATEHTSHTKLYVGLWAFLLVALLISLGLGPLAGSNVVVGLIFGIAAIKALAVLGWFMHLAVEPRFIKVLMGGAALLMAILFAGLVPDVAVVYGHMEHGETAGAAIAGTVPQADHPGDAVAGKVVYETYCVGCHQADGRGMDGTLAANLVEDPTRLAKSDDQLLAAINNGTRGDVGVMPPWGSVLGGQQQHDVLAYLRTSFGRKL